MAEETPAAPVAPDTRTDRQKAIQAYYDAKTREEKAAVVKQYPYLSEVFSAGNHS